MIVARIRSLFGIELARKFSIYAFGRVVGALASFTLLPLFTKTLPQAEFGLIGILWLVMPILSRLISLGMDVAVSFKFFKLPHPELSSFIHHALVGMAVSGVCVWTLGMWRIDWVQAILDPSMTRTTYGLLVFGILFLTYAGLMNHFLQLAGQAVRNAAVAAFMPVVVTATTYYLMIYVSASYTSYVAGMAVGYGIFGLVGLFYFLVKYPIKHFRPSASVILKLLRVGLPVLPGTVAGILLAASDRYVIKHFLGLDAVALYTYGYRFSEYITLSLLQPFQRALLPIVWKKASEGLVGAAEYNTKGLFVLLSLFPLLVAAIVVPMKDVMAWLGGVAYDQSYSVFLISTFGIMLYAASQISTNLLTYLERTDLSMSINLLGAAVNVGLNIGLIPRYGIVAGAITTIFSYLLMLVLTVMLVNRLMAFRVDAMSVLLRLTPFGLYLASLWLVDVVLDPVLWQAYVLKVGLFVCLALATWLAFSDVRGLIFTNLTRGRQGKLAG